MDDFGNLDKYYSMYEHIYEDYYAVVKRIVLRLLDDKSYVEDVIQDVFLKIFTSLPTFNEKVGSLGGWIVTITKSQVYEYYRHMGNQNVNYIEDVSLLVDRTTTDEQCELSEHLDYCLSELDEISKNVLILKMVYRFTHKEIAQHLNITEDISKKRFRKASKIAYDKWREYE